MGRCLWPRLGRFSLRCGKELVVVAAVFVLLDWCYATCGNVHLRHLQCGENIGLKTGIFPWFINGKWVPTGANLNQGYQKHYKNNWSVLEIFNHYNFGVTTWWNWWNKYLLREFVYYFHTSFIYFDRCLCEKIVK